MSNFNGNYFNTDTEKDINLANQRRQIALENISNNRNLKKNSPNYQQSDCIAQKSNQYNTVFKSSSKPVEQISKTSLRFQDNWASGYQSEWKSSSKLVQGKNTLNEGYQDLKQHKELKAYHSEYNHFESDIYKNNPYTKGDERTVNKLFIIDDRYRK